VGDRGRWRRRESRQRRSRGLNSFGFAVSKGQVGAEGLWFMVYGLHGSKCRVRVQGPEFRV